MQAKLCKIEPSCHERPIFPISLDPIARILKPMGPPCALCWLKTICNGWVTSARIRQSNAIFQNFHARSCCLFGCSHDEPDALVHYVHCIPLWSAVQDLIPQFVLSPFGEDILGVSSPSRAQFLGVLLGFHIYHTLKGEQHCTWERLKQVSQMCYKVYIMPHLKARGSAVQVE